MAADYLKEFGFGSLTPYGFGTAPPRALPFLAKPSLVSLLIAYQDGRLKARVLIILGDLGGVWLLWRGGSEAWTKALSS